MRRYCSGTYGGDDITSFGRQINQQKLMKKKYVLALGGLQTTNKKTQQPTKNMQARQGRDKI
jgi:hypothetical protein